MKASHRWGLGLAMFLICSMSYGGIYMGTDAQVPTDYAPLPTKSDRPHPVRGHLTATPSRAKSIPVPRWTPPPTATKKKTKATTLRVAKANSVKTKSKTVTVTTDSMAAPKSVHTVTKTTVSTSKPVHTLSKTTTPLPKSVHRVAKCKAPSGKGPCTVPFPKAVVVKHVPPPRPIPQGFTVHLTTGSLKYNVVRIVRQSHWGRVVWTLPFDYKWLGNITLSGPDVQSVIAQLLKPYPVQAVFYDKNHVVAVVSRRPQ